MGKVVELDVITRLPIPSDRLLKKALRNGVQNVVIIGYDSHGQLYFSSSDADGGAVLWLLEKAKMKLLEIGE